MIEQRVLAFSLARAALLARCRRISGSGPSR